MKIAIQAQHIFCRHKHATDFMIIELIGALQRADTVNEYRIYVAPGDDVCLESTPNFTIQVLDVNSCLLWEQVALSYALKKWKPDVLHSMGGTAPLYIARNIKRILTLDDVSFMESHTLGDDLGHQRVGRLYRRAVVPMVVKRSSRIITGSKYENEQIQKIMGLCPAIIEVVYNGVSDLFKSTPLSDSVILKYNLPSGYLFFRGDTNPMKNMARTMRAYSQYRDLCWADSQQPLPLVVDSLTQDAIGAIVEEDLWGKIKDYVVAIGSVDCLDLPMVYSESRAFLYTSLCESAYVQPLEAMGCGVPVLSCDSSAIPEILSGAAMLVDTMDVQALARGIFTITTDPLICYELVDNGYTCCQKYRWSDSARLVMDVYESVGGMKSL